MALDMLIAFIFTVALIFGSIGLGRLVLKKVELQSLPAVDRGLFYIAFGFAVINLILLFIGLFGQLNVLSVGIVYTLVACVTLIQFPVGISTVKRYFVQFRQLDLKNVWFLLLIPLIVLIVLNLVGSLAQPSVADALRHHLAASQYYARSGEFEFIPILFWNVPSFLHITYVTEILLINDIAPAVTHFAFSLLSTLAIFALGRRLMDWKVGLLAAVIFYSLPMSIELSVSPMVEMCAVFFVILALYSLCNAINGKTFFWIAISGLLIGVAGSTKIWAIMTIPAGLVFILFSKRAGGIYFDKNKILLIGIFIFTSLVVLSPWLIRNFIESGDPFWPLGYPVFNSEMWTQWHHEKFSSWHRGPGKSIVDFILGPWNLTNRIHLFTVDHGPLTGSLLTPILIIFIPAIFLFKSIRDSAFWKYILPILVFIFVIYLIWFLGYQSPRYFHTVYPVLALLSAVGIKLVLDTKQNWLNIPVVGLLTASLIGSLVVSIAFNSIFFPVVFGAESRNQFLETKVSNIESVSWINNNLNSSTNTLIMGLSGWYYLEYPWHLGVPSYQGEIDYHLMTNSEELTLKLGELGVTHILLQGRVGISSQFIEHANDSYGEKYLIEDLNVLQDNLENPVTTRMEFEARPFILMALLEAKGKLKRIYVGDEDVVKSRTFGSTEPTEFSVFEIIYDK